MKFIKYISLTLLASFMLLEAVDAQDKRAQTSMKFLQTSTFAGPAGMGSAMTAIESRSSQAMFYNPASMARIENAVDVSLGLTSFIADIDYNAASVAYRPSRGQYGVFGANAMYVDYGRIPETILDPNAERGYRQIGTFGPYALKYGLGYANAITNQFMVGGTFNLVTQDLGTVTMAYDDGEAERSAFSETTFTVDFGVLYHTGFESLTIAMSARNFSQSISFDDKEEDLPLEFRMGVAMDLLDLAEDINPEMHSLVLSIDAKRLMDYYEQLIPGIEYTFMDRFIVRGGYEFPTDEAGFSAGFGIRQPIGGTQMEINYAYSDFGIFEEVNRFSFQFSL